MSKKITALIILTQLTQLSFAYAVMHLQIPDTQNNYYDDENETDFSSSGDDISSGESNTTSFDSSNSITSTAHTLAHTITTLITPVIGFIISQL